MILGECHIVEWVGKWFGFGGMRRVSKLLSLKIFECECTWYLAMDLSKSPPSSVARRSGGGGRGVG